MLLRTALAVVMMSTPAGPVAIVDGSGWRTDIAASYSCQPRKTCGRIGSCDGAY